MLDSIVGIATAIESGRVTSEQWRRWAERMLLVAPENNGRWLVDLYDADGVDAALVALGIAARQHAAEPPVDALSLRLGFLFLDWERGSFAAADLLARAGGLIDAANYDAPSCETVYEVLNRLESRPGYVSTSDSELENRIHELFAQHGLNARNALERIERAT